MQNVQRQRLDLEPSAAEARVLGVWREWNAPSRSGSLCFPSTVADLLQWAFHRKMGRYREARGPENMRGVAVEDYQLWHTKGAL